MQILALAGSHDRQAFDCGRVELNDWFQRVARQHQARGLSKTFVAVGDEAPSRICGYYALVVSELNTTHLAAPARKRFPTRIPGVRLGRLAVDRALQARGLGELLLVDAIERTRRVQQQVGAVGLFVDAIDEHAAGFYLRFGFSPSPSNPLVLFLPVL